jgi:signal transduction histidine kinase
MAERLKVLFVEDSTDDRDVILRELGRSGLEASWSQVATPAELGEALKKPWDVVLCDYYLPGFGGLQALAIVRAHDVDLPLIIVSGVLGEEAAVAAMKAGADDFFSKDKLPRLGAAIERALADAHVRRARRQVEREKERLLAELERALVVRDDFLVLASHEFRTPLTVLQLQADGLTTTDEVLLHRIDRLKRQIDRMSRLIERLLDVTRLSSEPLRLSCAQTDLRALVLEVVERSRDWIDGAQCALTLGPMEQAIGFWDPVRLDSVVTSLLANALKYGAGKPVSLSVELRNDVACLTVRDEGIGISVEDQAKLFEKFSRVSPIRNYGGFGFGLWIVSLLVRAHHGTVEIRSEKGHGATFVVNLPTNQAETQSSRRRTPPAKGSANTA